MSFDQWRDRARFWWHWGDLFAEVYLTPYVSFSLDAFVYNTCPRYYTAYDDTNRWKVLSVTLKVSKLTVTLELPFYKLPDLDVPRNEKGRRRNLRLEALAAKRKVKNEELEKAHEAK